MTEQLQSIWYNFILNVKGNFNPIVDLLDILVVTFLIYEAISLVRQTRTAQLAKGIIAVLLAYAVANLLGMRTLAWLINSIMSFGIIALVVVFQPELRRALEQVGRTSLFGMQLFKGKADPGDLRAKWASAIVAVCDSAEQLADSRTGALVVLERRTIFPRSSKQAPCSTPILRRRCWARYSMKARRCTTAPLLCATAVSRPRAAFCRFQTTWRSARTWVRATARPLA